jgi:anthranilate phosphoribosyltransferase
VARKLDEDGFVFLFAPRYHPAFQHVMPVRRELGVRTLFNILGPLVNPARPGRHFLGVADAAQLSLVAETLSRTSSGSGAVVCGAGGYDELTTMGEAHLIFVENGATRPGTLDPAEYGFKPCTERELAVEGPEHAAAVLRELLRGEGPEAMREMLILNLAFALYLVKDGSRREYDRDCGYNRELMAQTVREARKAVSEGAGRRFCHA